MFTEEAHGTDAESLLWMVR